MLSLDPHHLPHTPHDPNSAIRRGRESNYWPAIFKWAIIVGVLVIAAGVFAFLYIDRYFQSLGPIGP